MNKLEIIRNYFGSRLRPVQNNSLWGLSPYFISALLFNFLFISCVNNGKTGDAVQFKNTDNTVYVRLPAEPDRLNPMISTNIYARAVNEQMFLYLLHFDPQTLELNPQLAKSRPRIEEIESGKFKGGVAYTFEIHEEAVWDNGEPVTGMDFEFTLKALFNPKVSAAAVRAYLEFIKDISIDPANPKKFTVYTDQKYIIGEAAVSNVPVFPEYLYDPKGLLTSISFKQLADPANASQLPADKLQEFADAFNSPQYSREKGFIAGAGPYEFEEWVTGQRIVLNKKADWWGEQLAGRYPLLIARPDKLVFKIIPDQTTALAALKDESIDVSGQIDARDFSGLKENEQIKKLFSLYSPSSLVYYYVGINSKNPRLSDKRVRRALAHLGDVDELIETLFYGLAERIAGPFHPAKDYYHKGLRPISFDIEKARALLQEAGWEDTNGNGIVDKQIEGEQLEFELGYLTSSGSKFGKNFALLFQDNAKKAGIAIHIVSKEFTVLIADLKKRDFELHGGAWAQDPTLNDPKQLWHTESDTPDGSNRVGFGNVETDALIDQIRITLDKGERDKLYRKFQEVVYDEQPYIFLFAPLERIAIHKRFEAETSVRRPGFFPNEFVKYEAVMN